MGAPGESPRRSILAGKALEAAAARECNNERNYRVLYSDMLRKVGDLSSSGAGAADRGGEEYEAENAILGRASSALMYAAGGSVAVGLAAFLSLRYVPTVLVKAIGGETKARALKESDAATSGLRKGGALLIEASFGFWAGWRGYHVIAERTGEGGIYEDISKIPLVPGRSAISDGLCKEWVDLTHNQIPAEFWHNLAHGEEMCKLRDYSAWEAIRSFAGNCVKRSRHEEALRREQGLGIGPIAIPAPGVPESISAAPLSEDEAKRLVKDAPITGR